MWFFFKRNSRKYSRLKPFRDALIVKDMPARCWYEHFRWVINTVANGAVWGWHCSDLMFTNFQTHRFWKFLSFKWHTNTTNAKGVDIYGFWTTCIHEQYDSFVQMYMSRYTQTQSTQWLFNVNGIEMIATYKQAIKQQRALKAIRAHIQYAPISGLIAISQGIFLSQYSMSLREC